MTPVIEVTPELIDRFRGYRSQPGNGVWGSLHIVLEDLNLDDNSVRFCIRQAQEQGDTEGRELGLVLLLMSRTQRGKVAKKARS